VQAKDIPDSAVLEYLADRQGKWTCLWYGYFRDEVGFEDTSVWDVYYSMPDGTPRKVALAKMRSLHRRKLVGGCSCGCRGDFEITDKGLQLIGRPRTTPYTGY
jgi:hypothetical protein